MSKKKEIFLKTLQQGEFPLGDYIASGEDLCASYFYGIVPHALENLHSSIRQEIVDRTYTDETGPMYSIWKFTIRAYREFDPLSNRSTEQEEEIFYLKFRGVYRSHEGSDYLDFKEVTPRTKTETVYE